MCRRIVVCLMLFAGLAPCRAADPIDPANLDKQICEALREVHNRGAEVHNAGDPIACYRMYQGGLMAVKPLLGHHPDVQKLIEQGFKAADQKPPVERAFALHTTMAEVRRLLRPTDVPNPNQNPTDLSTPKPVPPPLQMPTAPKPEPMQEPKANPNPAPASPFLSGPDASTNEPKPIPLPAPTSGPSMPAPLPAPSPLSLWDRLGGQPKVEKIVDELITFCLTDPKVNLSRDGKFKLDEETLGTLKRKSVGLISSLTEGSMPYAGPNLKEIQQTMAIKAEEWIAIVAHLRRALENQKVAEGDVQLLLKKLEDARSEWIVDPPK